MNMDRNIRKKAATGQDADRPQWRALKRVHQKSRIGRAELKQLIADGVIETHDLVIRRGWDRWMRAAKVPELEPFFEERMRQTASIEHDKHGDGHRTSLKQRFVHEMISFAGIAIYLWIILLLLKLHETIVLVQHGLVPEGGHSAIIQALIIGKVVLLAELLRLGNRIKTQTPAINIFWKSVMFAVALLLFDVLEHSAIAYWNGENIASALANTNTIGKILTIMAIMTIAFLPYFAYKEAQQKYGEFRLWSLLTGRGSAK